MPFFYYYDPYYWMILVPAMLIALLAQLNVSATFNRYSRISSAPAPRPPRRYSGPTGYMMCGSSMWQAGSATTMTHAPT